MIRTADNRNSLLIEELRSGWLGIPKRFQALDFLGTALGSYFVYAGVTGRAPQWSLTALGSIMIFIHSQRFFYAPTTGEGLIRLSRALKITPAELRMIASKLEHQQIIDVSP